MFSKVLFMPPIPSKFPKAPTFSGNLICYCSLTSSLLSLLRLYYQQQIFVLYFIYRQSFPNICNHQIAISTTFGSWKTAHHVYSSAISKLSIWHQSCCVSYRHNRSRSINECFRWGNIVLLTTKLSDVVSFTILTPLSLLSLCRFSFLMVGLKTASVPSLH